MAETPDDLERLLMDVRKTISENKQFLEQLMDEATEAEQEDEPESVAGSDDFEEL